MIISSRRRTGRWRRASCAHREPGPWAIATLVAQEVVSGQNYNPAVAEAVNYHANYVSPFWAGYLRRVDRIGAHIFYAMRDGVNWSPAGALNGHGDRP